MTFILKYYIIKKNTINLLLFLLVATGIIAAHLNAKVNSEKVYREYYFRDISGRIISWKRLKGGEILLRLDSHAYDFRSGLYSSDLVNPFQINDSISKPSSSNYLLWYRKTKDSFAYHYYYMKVFDGYEWKKPTSYSRTPDWKELQ